MAGLFLNFFKINTSNQEFHLSKIPYEEYSEDYENLKNEYPDYFFYRNNDSIVYWNKQGKDKVLPLNNSKKCSVNLQKHPRVFSKVIESCFIDALNNDGRMQVFYIKYGFSWNIVSPNNKLTGINGLSAYNCFNISFKFINVNDEVNLGISISLRTKFEFDYDRNGLENLGFDTQGLKGNDNDIFANTQSVSRYVKAMGGQNIYDNFNLKNLNNSTNYLGIIKFINWLNTNFSEKIKLPNDVKVKFHTGYNIPSNEFDFEQLRRPKKYFYSGIEEQPNGGYPSQQVKTFKPVSFDEIKQNVNIGVICPKIYEGRVETFLKVLKDKLENDLHISRVNFNIELIQDESLQSYSNAIYTGNLLNTDLVIVIVNEDQKKIIPSQSPYYFCKAKLVGNGIPTQNIKIETINKGANSFAMTNITLNIYAKLGGTAWTIEKEDKLKKEFIIGIGSTKLDDGKHVLGLAQIFDPDGRYLVGDCAPISTFDNYKDNLVRFLKNIISKEIESASILGNEEFRLIFHVFKSPSSKFEIAAVNEVINYFRKYSFKYALIHLAYSHNFRLFYNQGKNNINRGIFLPLNDREALLHFVSKSNLPLKINLDKRSTFQDLQYLSQQVYWFSDLSHRSYMPAKRTVTLMYPSLMVALTEKLKQVEGWDFTRLEHINDKLWFI